MLAEAVIVTVSTVLGVAGTWDMVSDTDPLVVVFVPLTGEVPVVDGIVNDFAPSAGSVLTANELLALA